jgi:glycosyltransferase involved in cell wall biosynthesis
LSGAWGRDPEPLLRALQIVRCEAGAKPIRLLHAGRLTTEERNTIARSGASDLVEHFGTLDRAGALALQRSADALVLLTSQNVSEATSKLFEYLSAGRPILALAKDNEAARIIRETNTGVAVPPDDIEAIVDALRQVASGELERRYAPRSLERYTYPGPAIAMADAIEEAIRRAGGGPG